MSFFLCCWNVENPTDQLCFLFRTCSPSFLLLVFIADFFLLCYFSIVFILRTPPPTPPPYFCLFLYPSSFFVMVVWLALPLSHCIWSQRLSWLFQHKPTPLAHSCTTGRQEREKYTRGVIVCRLCLDFKLDVWKLHLEVSSSIWELLSAEQMLKPVTWVLYASWDTSRMGLTSLA